MTVTLTVYPQALQQELADRRLELVDINSDVHSHVTSGGQSSLKEDVATLYRIWDEVNHRSVRYAFIRRTISQTGKMGRYGRLSYISYLYLT